MTRDVVVQPNDSRIVVARVGDADDPGILLLPATPDEAGWRAIADPLAEAGRHVVVALGGPAAVRGLLAAFGSRPVLVALGGAGAVAVEVLGRGGPHLATALVLIDPEDAATGDLAPAVPTGELADAAAAIAAATLVIRSRNAPLPAYAAALGDATLAAADDAETVAAVDRGDAIDAVLIDFLEREVPRARPEYRAGSDPRTLRDALGCFGTGVAVVTTRAPDGSPAGLTANSFTSVSLDPPLLLVCLAATASSLPAFAAADAFAVNVLHIGQQTVSGRFAAKAEDRFAATAWETWDTGAPIIEHSLASFDCTKHAWHAAGDHVILVGRVQRVRFEPRRDPLLYFRGRYRRLHFS